MPSFLRRPLHRPPLLAAATAFAAWLAVALAPAKAAAYCNAEVCFCRSTTCSGDCPRDQNGCKTTGEKLSWPTASVGYSIQKNGTANLPMSDVRPVIEASFYTWTDLPCPDGGTATMTFAELDDAACHKTEYNEDGGNANIIMFQDTKWVYKSSDNTLAKTTVSYDSATGEIFDADIEVNFAYNNFTVADDPPCDATVRTDCVDYDLQSVLTHEIGHFIGLDHSPAPEATMNAGYTEGDTSLRTLEVDDVAGACNIYPPGRKAKYNPTPHGGFASACSDASANTDSGGCACAAAGAPVQSGREPTLIMTLLLAVAARQRLRFVRSS